VSRRETLCINLPRKKPARGELRKIACGISNGMENWGDHCSIVDSMVIVTPIPRRYTSDSRVSRIKSDEYNSVVLGIAFVIIGYYCTLNTTIQRMQQRMKFRDTHRESNIFINITTCVPNTFNNFLARVSKEFLSLAKNFFLSWKCKFFKFK